MFDSLNRAGFIVSVLVQRRNDNIPMLPQLLHIVIENVRRDAAKVNAANRGDQAGRCVPLQIVCGAAGVLAIGLIEIADLYQHDAVRKGVFEVVIFSPKRGRLLFFMGILAGQGLLCLREKPVLCD